MYYCNTKTKESQWDHPLDVEYKKLVLKARAKQLLTADLSEEISQIDSGIKSLPGTDEITSDASVHSLTKKMDSFSGSHLTSHKFLAPIDKKGMQLQPLDIHRNNRFEVTSYGNSSSSSSPQPQIDLNIKNVSAGGQYFTNKSEVSAKEPIKSLTLSGTGSMFLKSNTKKIENSNNDVDRRTTLFGDSSFGSNVGVRGILRDSSLTDVKTKHTDQRISDTDGEDRKSVRFNLERSVQMNDKESSRDSSDVDDQYAEEDDWDFTDKNPIESHVKNVQVTLNRNNTKPPPVKPKLKTQFSLDEIKKPPPLNKLAMLGRTLSTDSGGDKSSISTIFDRKVDKNALFIKPLYEDTDSESAVGSIKAFPKKIASLGANLLKPISTSANKPIDDDDVLAAEEEKEKQEASKEMKYRVDKFKEKIRQEQLEEELNIRQKMQDDLNRLRNHLSDKQAIENDSNDILVDLSASNKTKLDSAIQEENEKFQKQLNKELEQIRIEHEQKLQNHIRIEEESLNSRIDLECANLESKHHRHLAEVSDTLQNKIKGIRSDLEAQHNLELTKFEQNLKDEFEEKRIDISNKHRSAVEILQRNHSEILDDLERDLKTEEDLLKKDHTISLAQLKDKLAHELELEKQRMRESGDYHMYEKMRCEKRLLEDKYKCLKEKYVRLKADIKVSLERRNRRPHASTTTGSETERSFSNKQSIGNSDIKHTSAQQSDHGKPPTAPSTPQHSSSKQVREKLKEPKVHVTTHKEKKFGAAAKYISHIQHHQDDTTSFSQSDTTVSNNYTKVKHLPVQSGLGENGNSDSEAFRRNQENNNNSRDTRKKLFTRMKSASTSRLNSSNRSTEIPPRPCTPVENLRRQLQKLEDLEDQFPENTLDTTYHLRYPFKDVSSKEHGGSSSELEFFKHRIHMERDSVRRAKESLRTQRTNFRLRQREIKQRHKNTARHTLDQLIQEEKELTEMEVNLHRTRALLGEKVIRLRHLEQSLQRAYEKEKPAAIESISDNNKLQLMPKEDATVSDLSSHSSSGFSSTDYRTDTNTKRNEMYQESSDIILSLEHLNAEIKEIWEILSKQRNQGNFPFFLYIYIYISKYFVI